METPKIPVALPGMTTTTMIQDRQNALWFCPHCQNYAQLVKA